MMGKRSHKPYIFMIYLLALAVVAISMTSCLNNAPNIPPTAAFQFSLQGDYAPLQVAFDASGSIDPDGKIVAYYWDFGDGTEGSGKTTTHLYTTPGTYTVSLQVIDDRNATGEAKATVEVLAPPPPGTTPPVASFTFSPQTPQAGEEVTFDASGSYDPASFTPKTIISYSWTFGDGNNGVGKVVKHVYVASGSYSVTLTLTDDEGAQAITQQTVVVSAPSQPPPVASFTFTPQEPIIGEEVTFTAEGSYDPASLRPKSIVSYAWDFGDGRTGTGKVVTHTYNNVGNFQVTLTVTDNEGAKGTAQQTITVGLPAPPPPPS